MKHLGANYVDRFRYDNISVVLVTDKVFRITPDDYTSKNGWYWRGGIGKALYQGNLEKVFKTKNIGDEFKCTLELTYSFDGEQEEKQVLEYCIKVTEGYYVNQGR